MYIEGYDESYAIIIGINKYKYCNPLLDASNDAKAISDILIEKFNFKKENVVLLLDEEATKDNIMNRYYELIKKTKKDDRVIFFYAGHGYTCNYRRGSIGYLVPVDGEASNLYTMIKWQELTEVAEQINAKHMLFIMDACYSGLALTRTLQPGTSRFLKDMLSRYTRQVITAGKGDETVSDANGPIANHSIFTGYLIKALNGEAKAKDGILTATRVMSYVYDNVSNDTYSQQTPHFGFFEGDGDFIFNINEIKHLIKENNKEFDDILVELPTGFIKESSIKEKDNFEVEIKELLSEEKNKIKLADLVDENLRCAIQQLNKINNITAKTEQEFSDKIHEYEQSIYKLQVACILISKWGNKSYIPILQKIFNILDNNIENDNLNARNLKWYPLVILLYSSLLSAFSTRNYEIIVELLELNTVENFYNNNNSLVIKIIKNILTEKDIFIMIQGNTRYYYPISEYLYKNLQPIIDDLLFVSKSYENLFDRVEIILGLYYAKKRKEILKGIWGSQGRFAYKANKEEILKRFKDEVFATQNVKDYFSQIFGGENEVNTLYEEYKSFIENLPLF